MPKLIGKLLEQEMDRREFLVRVGVSVLGIVGVTNILKSLSGSDDPRRALTGSSKSGGYGASVYGGGSERSGRRAVTPKPRQLG